MNQQNADEVSLVEFKTILEQQVQLTERLVGAVDSMQSTIQKLYTENVWQRQRLEQMRNTAMAGIRGELYDKLQSKQLGYIETLQRIADKRMSFARFGDGEFRLIVRPDFDIRFQKNSPELRGALTEVLTKPSKRVLVGMPEVFFDVHWSTVYSEVWHVIGRLIPEGQEFGNSHVTRPTAFQQFGHEAVEAWKNVWRGRKVHIVTGEGSRFTQTPALFDCAHSVSQVFSTATNAFSDVDRIAEELEKKRADVVILSLGPAGTVLAHRLAELGMQGLDIGHLSASYEHVIDGGDFPEKLPISK